MKFQFIRCLKFGIRRQATHDSCVSALSTFWLRGVFSAFSVIHNKQLWKVRLFNGDAVFSVRCELNVCKLFRLPYHGSGGYWTALTVEARVRSQASLVGQKSLPVLRYSFVSILTTFLYTFINLDTSSTTRTSEQSLQQSVAVFDIEIDRM
jgi:hypothetical protein